MIGIIEKDFTTYLQKKAIQLRNSFFKNNKTTLEEKNEETHSN